MTYIKVIETHSMKGKTMIKNIRRHAKNLNSAMGYTHLAMKTAGIVRRDAIDAAYIRLKIARECRLGTQTKWIAK